MFCVLRNVIIPNQISINIACHQNCVICSCYIIPRRIMFLKKCQNKEKTRERNEILPYCNVIPGGIISNEDASLVKQEDM